MTMARGKMGTQAALRRESQEVRSQIETYQRNVKRLIDENRELQQALADEKAAHADDVRVLRAQVDEGLSPELVALRKRVAGEDERVSQRLRAIAQRLQDLWGSNQVRMSQHAWDETQRMLGAVGAELFAGDRATRHYRRLTPKKARGLQDYWRQQAGESTQAWGSQGGQTVPEGKAVTDEAPS